jgi:hypothetical protein
MHRIWDWIVGLTMIAMAIVAGGIVSGMIGFPVMVGISHLVDLEGGKDGVVFLCSTIGVFAILQAAGFYDFYWRRRANYATGKAGFFHLVPRAIQRMRTGYEAEGFIDEATGMLTTIQAPINAARRGVVAVVLTVASVAAFCFGVQAKGEWALVIACAGLIGAVVALALLAQVMLAYAGFIRRH